MDEQFDNHLKNHIREVFENFEDPSADEGWLLLREKFPEKKKDRGIIWLWLGSAAAILLLLLGIGTWVRVQKVETQKLSAKIGKVYRPEAKPANKDSQAVGDKNVLINPGQSGNLVAKKSEPSIKDQNGSSNKNTGLANSVLPKSSAPSIPAKNMGAKPNSNNIASAPSANTYPDKNLVADKSIEKPNIANEKPISQPVLANDTAAKSNVIADVPKPVVKQTPPVFAENEKPSKERKATETTKKVVNDKKVLFGVYAATYFNYAKGSNNQLNIGAGVTSDIKLSKNLKLSTGIAIAQNSLDFGNQMPVQGTQHGYLAKAAVVTSVNTLITSSISYSLPTLKNYSAQLVGLDVPVNLKYEFNPQKSHSYISVGLSSGTFINEAYTSQYSYTSGGAYSFSNQSLSQSQPQPQTNSSSFSNFYFAKTLNVSFGLGYPLGKTNQLIVEPFLKYPLEGLGTQQLKFGAGGVNLKFDFQTSKK